MTRPLVSILMSCFNAERFVAAALESILAQTWHQIEIIAVNDGFTDVTSDVLERFADRGIRVIHQRNQGQCAAANRALAEAQGELIKFFDADDVMAPDMIERQVKRLEGRRDSVAMREAWMRLAKPHLRQR